MNRNAAHYPEAAEIVDEIGSRLWDHLEPIKLSPRCVLEVGARSSAISGLLRQRYKNAAFFTIGPVHKLLARPRRGAATWFTRAQLAHASCALSDALPLSDSFTDLLFANLSMDTCSSPEYAMREWARVSRTGGLLLFSSLGPDTCKELRMAAANVLPQTFVPPLLDMHDLGDLVSRSGFTDVVMETETLTLEYSDFTDVRRDLRASGLTPIYARRGIGLMGRTRYGQIVAAYEGLRRAGRLPLTLEVVYGHAWRSSARNSDADARVEITFQPSPGSSGTRP